MSIKRKSMVTRTVYLPLKHKNLERKSYRSVTALGRVNNDTIAIFGINYRFLISCDFADNQATIKKP